MDASSEDRPNRPIDRPADTAYRPENAKEEHGDERGPGSVSPNALRIAFDSFWRPAVILAIGLVLGLGALDALNAFKRVIFILILGIAFGSALEPIIEWLDRFMPRWLGIILTVLLIVVIIAGAGYFVVPQMITQMQALVNRLPDLVAQVEGFAQNFSRQNNLSLAPLLSSFSGLATVPIQIITWVAEFLLFIFTTIYYLVELPKMHNFVRSLFPHPQRERVGWVLRGMGESMGGYVRGAAIDGLFLAVTTYFGLLFLGFEFPLVIGVLSFFTEFIPTVGPLIVGTIAVATALLTSTQLAVYVLLLFIVIHQFENHILVPNVMHSQTTISTLGSVLALFAGALVGGLVGALAAIPLWAAARVFIDRVVAPAIRERTGAPPEPTKGLDKLLEGGNDGGDV